ncbi:MAG: DnaJ C-terminal domain-containing protein [Aeoliella sp.]
MANDPYTSLGVDRKASQEEISTAYRQLARKYHPDLNPDDESAKAKFQEVQTAFDVLGDEKKRKMFDRYGAGFESMDGSGPRGWPSGGPGGGPGGGVNFDFDVNDLFGAGAQGGGPGPGGFADLFKQFTRGGGAPPRQAPERGADLEYKLTVPLATAVLGGEAAISLRRASGKNETISVKIPLGIGEGKKIRLRGQGEQSHLGGLAGDLLITVSVAPHPHFTRTGNRLDVTVPITLAEAVEGAKIEVPTPHGTITLTVPPGTSSGRRLRVRGHGVKPEGQEPGDLYADMQVVVPENLSDDQVKQLVEIASEDQRDPRLDLRW